ncbi:MAG: hypothetical protein AAFS03_03750 [Pseudomonadota bacterium]
MTLLLLSFDRRVLDDEALWLKPLKFHLSLAVHGMTVLVAARFLPEVWQAHIHTKIGLFVFEAVIIYETLFLSLHAGRGVSSHFNAARRLMPLVGPSWRLARSFWSPCR